MNDGIRITSVARGSHAAEAGTEPGDVLVSVNGTRVADVIDYLALTGDEELRAVFRDSKGEFYEVEFPGQEDTGLSFAPGKVKTCANRCPFCFVDQMPRGFRPTLYLKDDDWRSSFMHGSYVTLTNLDEEDLRRIEDLRVSPLYVSVHATDDAVRRRLLGNEAAPAIMPLLSRFSRSGIRFYAQVVVVPGENDGEILAGTIRDLFSLRPSALSLSVVPVGLTRFRDALPDVSPVNRADALAVLETVEKCQKECLEESGTRFVFAADELYLKGERPIPDVQEYEDFSQLENGVGLSALFMDEARREMKNLDPKAVSPRRFVWAVGTSFLPCASALAEELKAGFGINILCAGIENRTFGSSVTVTGLLTGADIIAGLGDRARDAALILPSVVFRDKGDRTLDDMTAEEIRRSAGAAEVVLTQGGDNFVRAFLGRENSEHE